MRSVNFVKHFEIDFNGVVYGNAITLGDVNNDGDNELIIGNMDGELSIYKGQERIQIIKNLGLITAVGIGDVMNFGSNALVVVSGDGWCHIFLCLKSNVVNDEFFVSKLECVHSQRVPPNTKALLLGDVDNDGNVELVVGLTDRVVRSYRWVQNATSGKLVCLNKWECANQIGSVTLNYNSEGLPSLLISQPGGTFMRIQSKTIADPNKNEEEITTMEVDYHPLFSSQMRNPCISSEIIGNLKTNEQPDCSTKGGTRYAVATLDGSLMLVQDEKVVWSLQVDHQLFALGKLDVTGDGQDEIIASSWDGQTYILDQNQQTVCFHIEESISGFCAGLFSLGPSTTPVPCFIYTTFTDKVLVYYDINLPNLVTKNFFAVCEEDEVLKEVVKKLGKKQFSKIISSCLYKRQNES